MTYDYRESTAVNAGTGMSTGRAVTRTGRRTLAQTLAAIFGAIFLLVGIAGFIPGVVQNYDQLSFLGTESDAELLGLFRISIFHNLVHALFGVGLLAAARDSWAKTYLIGGGLAYAVVALYGAVIEHESDANFLPVNYADNVLHVGLALGLLVAGLVAVAADKRHDL